MITFARILTFECGQSGYTYDTLPGYGSNAREIDGTLIYQDRGLIVDSVAKFGCAVNKFDDCSLKCDDAGNCQQCYNNTNCRCSAQLATQPEGIDCIDQG